MGKILFIFVITGMVLGEGLSWARENYNVLPSEPQYIVPSRERMREIPENKETEKIEKERRNPNKEAERFAKLIERIFSEITPEELEKIKLNKENFLLTYLKNKARLIDFSEKPLEEEEIFKIFQENLILWNAELLRLYYEVNKIKIKESFGDFLEHLHKKEVISAEVAFFAGLAGKENKEFIGKFFQMLPEGEKITLKPEIKEKNPEKINFLLKEALAENILKKTSRDLSREKTPVKKLFLKIELGKGMKFLGLLVSTLGTVLVSPQGMFFERNFPQGIEFNLAEFLKMVIKAFSLVMPYITIPHQQLPPPISDGYWQYLLVILSFWIFLKRAERFNWGLVYLHIQEPLKDFLAQTQDKFKEKKEKTLKLLLKVKPPVALANQKHRKVVRQRAREIKGTGLWKARSPHHYLSSLHRKAWEEDVERRLQRAKYWANYLVNLEKRKYK